MRPRRQARPTAGAATPSLGEPAAGSGDPASTSDHVPALSSSTSAAVVAPSKYPRPKVLVIDAADVALKLRQTGYTVSEGSLGQPVTVERSAGMLPLKPEAIGAKLPGYSEQEIIVADLSGREPIEARPDYFQTPKRGVDAVWAPATRGLIDPRPFILLQVKDAMDRIYRHGGCFILFTAERFDPGLVFNKVDSYGKLDPYGGTRVDTDTWALLSLLGHVFVEHDTGEEMDVADNRAARTLGIDGYFKDGRFDCVMSPSSTIKPRWATLATSKYGDPVAGVIVPGQDDDEETKDGFIFLLPQVARRAELVDEIVHRILPNLIPRLFPHAEGSQWTRRDEYDLPRVRALRDEITGLEEATRKRVREFEEAIEHERSKHGFLHDLLTGTDDDLVQAVITAFKTLGFQDVRDVDSDKKAAGDTGPRREDIHLMDAAVPVLIEVKGITGTPKEASALQVAKYLAPRMREWKQTDLRGLAVVNHQRHIPALDREHDHVFQDDVIVNAEEQGFGVMTAWDLHRLVRGYLAHEWRHDDVRDLFIAAGRVRPIPTHYQYVGSVDGFWEQASALGMRVEEGTIAVGDRVAFELPVDFVEEDVRSLRLNDTDIANTAAGSHVGLKTTLTKAQARKGVRVYRVARSDAPGEPSPG